MTTLDEWLAQLGSGWLFVLVLAAVLVDGRLAAEILAPRRAAKLAAPQHQRFFEQAA